MLCLVYVHVHMGGMEQNRAANIEIWLREIWRCVSKPRTATERIHTDGQCNDLYVTADRGHILTVHGLMSSFRTRLARVPPPSPLCYGLVSQRTCSRLGSEELNFRQAAKVFADQCLLCMLLIG